MRRISVFAVIATITTFMVVSMVSAGKGNPWKNFHGTYEMISSGICLHSTSGWTKTNPDPPPKGDGFVGWKLTDPVGQVWAGTATARATWVFKRGGTGTLQGTNFAAIFPGADKAPYEATNPIGGTFNYEITNNGEVTVTGTSGGIYGIVLTGMLSIDKKIMTLLSASQPQNFSDYGLGFVVIDNMRILIKVGN